MRIHDRAHARLIGRFLARVGDHVRAAYAGGVKSIDRLLQIILKRLVRNVAMGIKYAHIQSLHNSWVSLRVNSFSMAACASSPLYSTSYTASQIGNSTLCRRASRTSASTV